MYYFRYTVTALDPSMKFALQTQGYIEFRFDIASCEYEESKLRLLEGMFNREVLAQMPGGKTS